MVTNYYINIEWIIAIQNIKNRSTYSEVLFVHDILY